ncbi:uncharacterized protein LOC132729696 isoform X2 [Ruditapes philippinarum]|uniref:uncharacterized protein LOC132729696 isoform X2 n=1 Tax=Ruditapes philippinarum TaxID=129788 RepID=UPI00295AE004|nr:uncharacterized protein LOC132729696 isoform X2 [Ruditapes philippinarum]
MATCGTTRTKAPDLPANKDFHLFVSYCSEDTDQVRIIVDNLEKMDIKCYYSDRDFIPGEQIIENTNDGMKRSAGMLLVLTEGFNISKFCKYELTQALHLNIDENFLLVPLKLEPCVVPPNISTTTSYIDAEDIPVGQVHEKILKALVDREIKKEKAELNGITAEIQLKPYKRNMFTFARYRLENISEARNRLIAYKIDVQDNEWEKIEEMVNKSHLVKYKHIYGHSSSICCSLAIVVFLFLLLIMIIFLVVLLATSTEMPQKSITPAGIVLAVLLPALILLWICSYCTYFKKFEKMSNLRQVFSDNYVNNFITQERRRLNKKLWDDITLDSDDVHKRFVFFDDDSLCFMQFNWRPCKDLFIKKLAKIPRLIKYIQTDESHEDYTDRVFRTFLRYNIHKLKEKSTVRHRNISNAKCICLLAEEWILEEK